MAKNNEFIGFVIGWFSSFLVSNNKSPIEKKLPNETYKGIEVIPNLEVKRGNSVYHIHHWIYILLLYYPLTRIKKLNNKLIKGFLIGDMLQGLSYKDRFKIKDS